MRRQWARTLRTLEMVIGLAVITACAAPRFDSSAPGPDVPRISNFRIEPAEVEDGGRVTLRFDFADGEGDIVDVHLGVSAEINHFTLATGIRSTVISRGRYFGQMRGTVEETITVTIDPPRSLTNRDFNGGMGSPNVREGGTGGIRVYKVFVVDRKGGASNALRAQVTVRPSSASTRGGPLLHGPLVSPATSSKGKEWTMRPPSSQGDTLRERR